MLGRWLRARRKPGNWLEVVSGKTTAVFVYTNLQGSSSSMGTRW